MSDAQQSEPTAITGRSATHQAFPDLDRGERALIELLVALQELRCITRRGIWTPNDPPPVSQALAGWLNRTEQQLTVWRPALDTVRDAATEARDGKPLELGHRIEPSAVAMVLRVTDEALGHLRDSSRAVETASPQFCDQVETLLEVDLEQLRVVGQSDFAVARHRRREQGGPTNPNGPPGEELRPLQYLLSWSEILDALNLKNNGVNQSRVRQLNELYGGPIVLPGKGGQPKVSKDRLLPWWNKLEERFQELEQKQADTQATLQAQHSYGRDGQVLPAISGHVKKRRRKKGDHS
jgi:hypothetical protein